MALISAIPSKNWNSSRSRNNSYKKPKDKPEEEKIKSRPINGR